MTSLTLYSGYVSIKYDDLYSHLGQFIPSTSPDTRYSLNRLEALSDQDDLYIYDYSSFTSRLVDNRSFIDNLSLYCMDTSVFILDTFEGPRRVNLGLLLKQYNEQVNFECPYDVTRILGLEEPLILHMASSGPLGVPGNIVSSTTTHGIVQAEITGSVDRGNAIGDDAIGLREKMGLIGKDECLEMHRSIGAIERSKMCWWCRNSTSGCAWHYVKRPLDRIEDYIVQGWMPDFPNYPVLLGIKDDNHTVPVMEFETRRAMCAKQVGRFFDRIVRSSYEPSSDDIGISLNILRYLYFRLQLDERGSWPDASKHRKGRSSKKLQYHFVPPLLERCFTESWLRILLDERPVDAIVLLPREDEGEMELPDTILPGDSFVWRGSRILGAMDLMGKIEKRKIYDEVLVNDAMYERIMKLVGGSARLLYRYTCIDVIPFWEDLLLFFPSDPPQAEVTFDDDMDL